MEKINKIAIGGSAANPPHKAHYMLLDYLRNYHDFDMIIWILSGTSIDKTLNEWVTPDDRVAMTELMIPKEWRLRGPKLVIKYTDVYGINVPSIIHLERLRAEYPYADITWYSGTDQDPTNWYRGEELVRNWKFLYINREGYKKMEYSDFVLPNISSTEIRELVSKGEPFSHLVTEKVADYIKINGLYRRK